MLLMEVLQSRETWHFDIRSAIIGAILAWIVVGALYSQRVVVRRVARNVWEPIAAWRRRLRASQGEKYARALEETLRRLLLLEPTSPDLVLRSPTYQALAPLPTSVAEAATAPRTMSVPQAALLAGHNRLVLTGRQGTGRTSALIITARELMSAGRGEADRQAQRLPVWIDLACLPQAKVKRKTTPVDQLVELATAFLPEVLPSWLSQRLRREPCAILMDNWEALTQDQRMQVAGWIRDANESFDDVVWIVASAPEGYGLLVEAGFVPIELRTGLDRAKVSGLYQAWRELLAKDGAQSDDEIPDAILEAADAGAPLWELHLRSLVHLETGELPERPVEVIDRALQLKMEAVDLGRMPEDAAVQAREIALLAMVKLAVAERLEGHVLSEQVLRSTIVASMPPKPDHARRLEATVHKLLTTSGLLRAEGKDWRIAHGIWADYLAAIHMAESEEGNAEVEEHLDDPTWDMLTELYAGMADVGAMVQTLANQAAVEADEWPLLRAARWGVSADPGQPWRKALNKVLAQAFMRETLDTREPAGAHPRTGIGRRRWGTGVLRSNAATVGPRSSRRITAWIGLVRRDPRYGRSRCGAARSGPGHSRERRQGAAGSGHPWRRRLFGREPAPGGRDADARHRRGPCSVTGGRTSSRRSRQTPRSSRATGGSPRSRSRQ